MIFNACRSNINCLTTVWFEKSFSGNHWQHWVLPGCTGAVRWRRFADKPRFKRKFSWGNKGPNKTVSTKLLVNLPENCNQKFSCWLRSLRKIVPFLHWLEFLKILKFLCHFRPDKTNRYRLIPLTGWSLRRCWEAFLSPRDARNIAFCNSVRRVWTNSVKVSRTVLVLMLLTTEVCTFSPFAPRKQRFPLLWKSNNGICESSFSNFSPFIESRQLAHTEFRNARVHCGQPPRDRRSGLNLLTRWKRQGWFFSAVNGEP